MSEESKKFTKPVFMKKLAAKCGSLEQLGNLVGCSGSHAGNIVNDRSECALSYELAAENLYQKQHGGGGTGSCGHHLGTRSCSQDHRDAGRSA